MTTLFLLVTVAMTLQCLLVGTGTGIAMGNAYDELKFIADYITNDIDCDGVYNALRHFGLI